MLRDQFSFRVCDWLKKNCIFEPKIKSKKLPKYPSVESHQQPYLSFLFRNLLNNKRVFHFYLTDFRLCLTPVSKSNINEVPEISKNIDSWYIIIWKTLWYIKKGPQSSPFFFFSLNAHNPELTGRIVNWRHFEAMKNIPELFLFITLARQFMT